MPINEEMIEARIREINDAVQELRDLTTREFDELNTYQRLATVSYTHLTLPTTERV